MSNLVLREVRAIEDLYPGLHQCLPVEFSDAELEHIVIRLSQYTGAETQKIENYFTRRDPRTRQESVVIIPLWGVVAYRKEEARLNKETGELVPSIGVVYKARFNEEEGDVYISTEGVSTLRFFKRTLLVIRPIGDWEQPLYMIARPVSLQVGGTYSLSLVDAPN